MIGRALEIARYRMRATIGHRWRAYVTLVVLVGFLAGLGLGGLAAARRTQSSFSSFLAASNPSDIDVTVYGASSGPLANPNYNPALTAAIAHLPGVSHVAPGFLVIGAPLTASGAPRIRVTGLAYPVASVNGLFYSHDRVAVSQGRMAVASRPNEIMMAPSVAQLLGVHVGQTIPFGFYSDAQQGLPGFGTAAVRPALRINMRLVGLAVSNSEIVEDDVDTFPTFIPLTPAFAREVFSLKGQQMSSALTFGIQTRRGSSLVPQVERGLARIIPPDVIYTYHALAPATAKADRSLRPISIALGVFGAVTLLAAVLVAAQLIARRFRTEVVDREVLRALGANPADTVFDGLIGLEGAILLGAALAAGIAIVLSPVAPLGPVRSVYPGRGFAFDWTVLGYGILALLVVLTAIAVSLSIASAPHRVALRPRLRSGSGARMVASMARAGLPAPGVVGVRMALEPGEGRSAVPVRSALLGSILAVALVVTTVVFGSSLQTLISSPALYGWNWTYVLNPIGSGGGNVPQVAFTMLRHDSYVAAYSGASYNDIEIDGQAVPFLIENAGARVTPPILSGRPVTAAHQVVLGASTLALLGKRIGDYVTMTYGTPSDARLYVAPTKLRIVGTATFPAVGFASTVSDHTSMGTGALLANQVMPASLTSGIDSGSSPALEGPNMVLVRLKPDAPPRAAMASLQRIAQASNQVFANAPGGASGNAIVVQGVQRPAEIVNYKTIGITPTLLVSGLALGAIAALALTLLASVRQRRRDLALLKTIGFVRRQLAAAVAWQATVAAVVGIAVGMPLGVIAGRWLWNLFAEQIYAVPYPTVPVLSLVLVAVGTLVLANVIAAVPARTAARTPTAFLLRSE
ncbi:MAG TPA: FtsX-like permease family protein [Acidimicrobiales bacterium]|nr:FtsX-like permease family protein [Acidimicrobiales bacterium]